MGDLTELQRALAARFGTAPDLDNVPVEAGRIGTCLGIAGHMSCRHFAERKVPGEMVELVAALALSAPSKSDLQQRDVVWLRGDQAVEIKALLAGQEWIRNAPELLVFCGNNTRQRQMHALWERPFANDHLDAFFNASVDAGIALATGVVAAEALGLGCCPISTIRDVAPKVSRILHLPDHVFPVAALALGWPGDAPRHLSPRLPLHATFHKGRYRAPETSQVLASYDATRHAKGPNDPQRSTDMFGVAERYTWSDDKTRQYSRPERPDFGDYIRSIGFKLD